MPWDRALDGLGRARATPARRTSICSRRHARARRRPRRGRPAPDRRGLPQQPQGEHRRADVLAGTSSGSGAWSHLDKARRLSAATALRREHAARTSAPDRRPRGATGPTSRRCTRRWACRPSAPAAASRVAVPVYKDGRQVGKATTTAWSPTLKRLIALATIDRPHFAQGTELQIEITVEADALHGSRHGGADAVPEVCRRRRTAPVTVTSLLVELARRAVRARRGGRRGTT